MDIIASLQNIGFDWRLMLAHTINFLIVFALLKYYVFGPIRERLNSRQEKIKQGLADARSAEKERQKAQEEYEAKLTEARQEAQQILSQAREQADKTIAQAKSEAQEEAGDIIEQAKSKAEAHREEIEREFRAEAGSLVVAGVRSIIGEEIDEETGERVIKERLNQS